MIKFKTVAGFVACCSLCLPALASAQIKKTGPAYLFRLKFKVGTLHKYNLGTKITGLSAAQGGGAGGGIDLKGTLQQKVVSVAGKSAKVEVTTSALNSATGGSIGQPQTAVLDVDELSNASSNGKTASFAIPFSKTPVKVGGTWTQKVSMPGSMGGSSNGAATYRFNGIKKVGKQNLADVTFSVAQAGMMKSGTGHALLQPTDGSLVSLSLKLNVANPQGGADLTTLVVIDLIK